VSLELAVPPASFAAMPPRRNTRVVAAAEVRTCALAALPLVLAQRIFAPLPDSCGAALQADKDAPGAADAVVAALRAFSSDAALATEAALALPALVRDSKALQPPALFMRGLDGAATWAWCTQHAQG
jgi:hypothetical protein